MSRVRIPEFVRDVIRDPKQKRILIAGSLSLFAVGMVPRVLAPGLADMQAALRAQPEVENLFLLLSFAAAATIIVGGLVSDIFRRRSLLLASLLVMAVAALTSAVFASGVVFYLANFSAVVASGVALAYGIGSVAVAYEGIPRATALGFVYAAYGAAAALAPMLLTIFGSAPSDPRWQAYLPAAIAAAVALWAAWKWMPALPGSLPAPRRVVAGVALWSISILAIVIGALSLPGAGSLLLPIVLIVLGSIGLSTLSFRSRLMNAAISDLHLDRRAVGATLAVGVAVGFAQAVPLMLLPIVFQYSLGYGALFATLAIAPFAIALFLAGPISGILLQRLGPRGLMTSGTLFLGVADLLLAVILGWFGRDVNYLAFVLPLVFLGAGFVVATTVRTAIVFASTPRGLPGSAAAINEAAVSLGSRIGIVGATATVATVALRSVESTVAGLPDAETLVSEFDRALVALGTPGFGQTIAGATLEQQAVYGAGYIDGVQVALAASGLVGILGAALAWFLTGRRDPLRTVFDMQDERQTTPESESA